MKLQLVQMKVRPTKEENLAVAVERIAKAAAAGADLIVLPEMFCCPYQAANFPVFAEEEGGPAYTAMAKAARENGVWLVAGSMPEREGDRIYNTAYVFDREGKQAAKHRKMHLFDIDVKGGQRFFESDTLSAGDAITTFDTEFCRIGLCICYDIRFPELSRLLADDGAKLIIYPAAFNMTTGPAHWEISFRMRAVDNQVFTVGAAPARDLDFSYHAYGNSIVCSPWGEVLLRLDEREASAACELDLTAVERVRGELPLLRQRRKDIYTLHRR